MENKYNFKYNYILYNMESAYKWQMYGDLLELDNVRMCRGGLPMNEKLLHKIHKLHWSARINRKINLPFKKIWFKKMTDGKFKDNKPTCFILFGGQYGIRDPRILDYMKALNPENKIALHYRDLVKNEEEYLDMLKEKTDVIYTYDKGEAEKYGFEYDSDYVYSRLAETTEPDTFDYDLFFVGYAKDRLELIHNIFKKATDNGFKCKFIIVAADKNQQLDMEGIDYLDRTIPYKEVVDYVCKSKCVLEVTQENAEGATMRTAEAILYKRKLLSNCRRVTERPYYNSRQMREFTSENDIDFDFLREPISYEDFADTESFSPVAELQRLEKYFATGKGFDEKSGNEAKI